MAPRAPRERGFAAVAALLFASALMALLLSVVARVRAQAGDTAPAAASSYLSAAQAAVQTWYTQNAASVDGGGFALDGNEILAAAGVPRRYGLQARVSNALGLPCLGSQATCIAYRVIALWLPPGSSPDTTAFDPATGTLTPAPKAQWATVSGQPIEFAAVSNSLGALTTLQTALQSYFSTRERRDGTGTTDTNWFRASPCSDTASGALPCVDNWTAGGATGMPALSGIDASRFYDAWGNPIDVTNLVDSSTSAPYSMALKTTTPWGSTLEVEAVQPM